jgi:hypothetical protein
MAPKTIEKLADRVIEEAVVKMGLKKLRLMP